MKMFLHVIMAYNLTANSCCQAAYLFTCM